MLFIGWKITAQIFLKSLKFREAIISVKMILSVFRIYMEGQIKNLLTPLPDFLPGMIGVWHCDLLPVSWTVLNWKIPV